MPNNIDQISQLRKNIPKTFALGASWMFLVIMPVIVPYLKSLNLDMEEIYLCQAIFALSVVLLELPSGYISDLIGRKKAIIYGTAFHSIGFTIMMLASNFWHIAATQIFLAIGVSLFSGSDIALIYDTLDTLKCKRSRSKLLGEMIFYKQLGETCAAILAAALAYFSLFFTVVANAIISWIPFIIALSIIEPTRKYMSTNDHSKNFKYIYKSLFKREKVLTLVILNNIIYGLATLVVVWAFQDYWKHIDIPISMFGILWAITNLTVAVTGKFAHRIESTLGSTTAILLISLLPIIGYFGISLTTGIIGILFCLLFQVSRGLNQVILKDALNKRVASDMRATANSVTSLGVRLIFVFAGPLMGRLLDGYGYEVGFQTFGVIYILLFTVLTIPLIRQRNCFKIEGK